MKNYATFALLAALAVGSAAPAAAAQHTYLNPQPLPPMCALVRATGNPVLDYIRAIVRPMACPRF